MDLCSNSVHYGASVAGHSFGVKKEALKLALVFGADMTVCGPAGVSHDIGSITEGRDGNNGEGHHRVGARKIKPILRALNYPPEKIRQIQYCIFTHRGSTKEPRMTLEARIIASADAINHFDRIDELWRVGRRDQKLDADAAYGWLAEKLEKDWEKIMPEVREMVRGRYLRAWTILMRTYVQEPVC